MDRPPSEIDYPKTKGEWWSLVEREQWSLQDLVAKFHPDYRTPHPEHPVTASRAEMVCEVVRKTIRERPDPAVERIDPVEKFRGCLETLDGEEMYRLLNETWFGMPESESVRSEPGFGVLCDLCSEAYVLEEEQSGEDQS
jgi:hypothetical protein